MRFVILSRSAATSRGLLVATALLTLATFVPAQEWLHTYDFSGNFVVRNAASVHPPQIIGQPQTKIVEPGHLASFTVVMADTRGLSYQWRFNDTDMPGRTNDALLLPHVSAPNEGLYAVVVSNNSGSVTSAPAMLMLDSDGDDLPDSWELAYFVNLSQTATGDFDGDGVSNLDEFLQGTEPNNNASLRVRLSVTVIGGGTVDVSPFHETYAVGETVTLTAIPSSPNSFDHWSGSLSGSVNPSTLVLTATKSVTAHFIYVPVPPGLIAWWRGEADASDLIAGHHGAFYVGAAVVGPSVTPSGLVGGAFEFDGSVHIRVPGESDLRPARLTVETWVFPTVQSASPQTIVARGSASNDDNAWSLSILNGRPRFSTITLGFGAHLIDAPNPLPLNEWTHLAITFDGYTKSLYVNGALARSESGFGPLYYDPAAVPVTIGSDWAANASSDRFTGRLDEVSLYGRALTGGEIATIASAARLGKSLTQPYITTPAQLSRSIVGDGYLAHLVPQYRIDVALLPEGIVGDSYTGSIAAVIGALPMSFSVWSGDLPPGLSMGEPGLLSGVPTIPGDHEFTVVARDATGSFKRQVCSLRVTQRIAPPFGMLAWWRAEPDPSGLATDGIAGHDGTFYSGPTAESPAYTAEGKVANAFAFDYPLYIRVPDSPSLRPAQVTVEAWVYPTWRMSYPQGIVARGSAGNYEYPWYLGIISGQLQFYSQHQSLGASDLYSPNPLPLYEWSHVAATFDDGKKVLYVNGMPVASRAGLPAFKYNAGPAPVLIGAGWSGFESIPSFQGRLDEVTLYGRALNEGEIMAIANAGAAGKSISGPSALDLGSVAVDRPFSYHFTYPAGVAPVSFSLVSGTLPPGFVLASDGLLSGTATGGHFTFTVRATDANGEIHEQAVSLRVLFRTARPEGLISWWRAENDAQDAIGANHGVAANPASYRAGQVGAAFSFNGTTDFIQIPDAPSLRPASVTLEAWVTANSVDFVSGIVGKPAGTTSASWSIYCANGYLYGGIGNVNNFVNLASPLPLLPGRWYHVAYAFDDPTRQHWLYVDGVRVASGPVNLGNGYDSQPMVIGRNFNGVIDEVSIYSRALGDTEIASIYSAGPAGKEPLPLVLRASVEDGFFILSFEANVGTMYTVQYADGLTAGTWAVSTNITAVNTNVVYSESISNAPQRFYRLLKTAD